MAAYVIDTNVLVVANDKDTTASAACMLSCVNKLLSIASDSNVVCIDSADLIMGEYRRYCNYSGAPGVGDMFFRYVHDNLGNTKLCEQVDITPCEGGFAEFPSCKSLARFDLSDRKFVAVLKASASRPVIINATDSDWRDFRQALAKNKISVSNLAGC